MQQSWKSVAARQCHESGPDIRLKIMVDIVCGLSLIGMDHPCQPPPGLKLGALPMLRGKGGERINECRLVAPVERRQGIEPPHRPPIQIFEEDDRSTAIAVA